MKKGVIILLLNILLFLYAYQSIAAVPDQDKDGIPDLEDRCLNSDSYIVDKFGCSCEQKTAPTCDGAHCCPTDNNICTNDCDQSGSEAVCVFVNNKVDCGDNEGICYKGDCVQPGFCGDGIIDNDESCDGNNFGSIDSCTDYSNNFVGGTLRCTNTCQLDTSGCLVPQQLCGDGIIHSGEECDGDNFGSIDSCTDIGYEGGVLSCTNNCRLDFSGCLKSEPTCGNGIVDPGEICDGDNFGSIDSCTDFSSKFVGGSLTCTSNCLLDTSACIVTKVCGNGLIDEGEQCDGNDLGSLSKECSLFSDNFVGGSIKCTNTCQLTTSDCVEGPICGNGILEANEQCDGNNFGGLSRSCADLSSEFSEGNLECDNNCKISTQSCIEESVETCTDSDGGKAYEKFGIVKLFGKESIDSCFNNDKVAEYYCHDQDSRRREVVRCSSLGKLGCVEGQCVGFEVTPPTTSTDSDGGRNYEEFGIVTRKNSGREYNDYCINSQKLKEFYISKNGFIRSENHICENRCENGACLKDICSINSITITDILNNDGKIAVNYKTNGVKLKVELIAKYSVNFSGGGAGGAGIISCPIISGGCSVGPNSNVVSCTANTDCSYPDFKPNAQYYIKLSDLSCQNVYDQQEIKPATCTDSDGGKDYFRKGIVRGFDGGGESLFERGLGSSDGVVVLSQSSAILKINSETKEVSLGETYEYSFADIMITDIDFFGRGNQNNRIEVKLILLKDVCDEDNLVEFACDLSSNEPRDYNFQCPNGCKDGACIAEPTGEERWLVRSPDNELELTESLISGINRESITNIIKNKFISAVELPNTLSSGVALTSLGKTPYIQKLYFEDSSSGYVQLLESDDDITEVFLYFPSNTQIARYELEFTNALVSKIYENEFDVNLLLGNLENAELKILGKKYVISHASINPDGPGVRLILRDSGSQKLELYDKDITDTSSSSQLKVNNELIDGAYVKIIGKLGDYAEINKIIVDMVADDDYYVPAGKGLSEIPDLKEKDLLFTRNWDIKHNEPINGPSNPISILSKGSDSYMLEFFDGFNHGVQIPLIHALNGSAIKLGDSDNNLVVQESRRITKNDYFILTDYQQDGRRKSFALRYLGADKLTADNPVLIFEYIWNGERIEVSVLPGSSYIGHIKLGGSVFRVYGASSTSLNDFDIFVDMDADGILGDSVISLNTFYGAEIYIQPPIQNSVFLSISTPNKEDYGDLVPTQFMFDLYAKNGRVMARLSPNQNHIFRTPDLEDDDAAALSSYGAIAVLESLPYEPQQILIDYPKNQRLPLVYITGKGQSPAPFCGNNICEESEKRCISACPSCASGTPPELCGKCKEICTTTCPQDCGDIPRPVCGNDICEKGEATECTQVGECTIGSVCEEFCSIGTCPRDCDNQIEVKAPSSFSLAEGQSALVVNYKNMLIKLNEIIFSTQTAGASGKSAPPPPPPSSIANIVVSAPGGCNIPPQKCSLEGQTCGGFAGTSCCNGLACELDGRYPDASGTCVEEKTKCRTNLDCPQIICVRAPCPQNVCVNGQCVMDIIGCTEEEKICPDGSSVGRVPPSCNFAPCPSVCGNGICEGRESSCQPSNCWETENGIACTTDCGPYYCPQDCVQKPGGGGKGVPPPPPQPTCPQLIPGCYNEDGIRVTPGTLALNDLGGYISQTSCLKEPNNCQCNTGTFAENIVQNNPSESASACSCLRGSSWNNIGGCCGDGVCGKGETEYCLKDCLKEEEIELTCADRCGDGICQEVVCLGPGCACGESSTTCPQDCKLRPTCGNNICEKGEATECSDVGDCFGPECEVECRLGTCPRDCKPQCLGPPAFTQKYSIREGESVNAAGLDISYNGLDIDAKIKMGKFSITAQKVCPKIYDPVCGIPPIAPCPPGKACPLVVPRPKTYSNLCILENAGAQFLYNGVCKTDAGKPYVKIISPNGNEQWPAGSTQTIIWEHANVDKVSIGYKTCPSCLEWIVTNLPTPIAISVGSATIPESETIEEKTDIITGNTVVNLCGNGILDPGETCDGNNFGLLDGTCNNFNPLFFTGGKLSCSNCNIDTNSCFGISGPCGDGIINIGEECDGKEFGLINECTDYPDFAGGTLTCISSCRLDTSRCAAGGGGSGGGTGVSKGFYRWKIPSNLRVDDNYQIYIIGYNTGVGSSDDASDNNFVIGPPGACTDSDGGKEYYVKGFTSLAKLGPSDRPKPWNDLCLKDFSKYKNGEYSPPEYITEFGGLLEGVCGSFNNEPGVIINYECPNGCKDGACIQNLGEIFKEGRFITSPVSFNENDKVTQEFMKADANGDTVVTGEELCQYNGMTCLYTQDITYNVESNQGNIVQVAGPTIGCFGGFSFDAYRKTPNRGFGAMCVKDSYVSNVFKEGRFKTFPFQFNDNNKDTSVFIKADANGDTVVTGEELCNSDVYFSPGMTCLYTQRITHNVKSNQGNIQEVTSPTIGCFGGADIDFYRNNIWRGFGAMCVKEDNIGKIFKEGSLITSPFQFNDNDEDTKDFINADSNKDTVVTGEELCNYHGFTCLYTQSITYNVESNQGNIVEVAGPTIGCFGGESIDFYRKNLQRGFGAMCVITASTQTCTDSDGGKNYYKKGDVKAWNLANGIESDVCNDRADLIGSLREFYCEGGAATEERYWCPNGCKDGACLPVQEEPIITVLSPNGGEEWETGSTSEIKWATARPSTVDVGIIIERYDDKLNPELPVTVKTFVTKNTGSYNWNIPEVGEKNVNSVLPCQNGCTTNGLSAFGVRVYYVDIQYPNAGASGLGDASDAPFSIISSPACTDSDNGKVYGKRGIVTYEEKEFVDFCSNKNKVIEYYCDELDVKRAVTVRCNDYGKLGCFEGECVNYDIKPSEINTDSDGGKNYFEIGVITKSGKGRNYIDYCIDNNKLKEYFVNENGGIRSINYDCPDGCDNGACLSPIKPYVDLKINGQDGPFIDVEAGDEMTLSWTSKDVVSCAGIVEFYIDKLLIKKDEDRIELSGKEFVSIPSDGSDYLIVSVVCTATDQSQTADKIQLNIIESPIFPSNIGDYVLFDTRTESECNLIEDHPDTRWTNLTGDICVNILNLQYRREGFDEGVFVNTLKITKGKEIYKKLLQFSSKPAQVDNYKILILENHELFWWTLNAEKYDLIITQEFNFTSSGTGTSYFYGTATGNNPVTRYLLENYPPVVSISCTDSDNGKNYFVRGEVEGKPTPDYSDDYADDYCNQNGYLIEYYLNNNCGIVFEEIKCENGCKDGACITEDNCNQYGSSYWCDTYGGWEKECQGTGQALINTTCSNPSVGNGICVSC